MVFVISSLVFRQGEAPFCIPVFLLWLSPSIQRERDRSGIFTL